MFPFIVQRLDNVMCVMNSRVGSICVMEFWLDSKLIWILSGIVFMSFKVNPERSLAKAAVEGDTNYGKKVTWQSRPATMGWDASSRTFRDQQSNKRMEEMRVMCMVAPTYLSSMRWRNLPDCERATEQGTPPFSQRVGQTDFQDFTKVIV